jgi:uncharacterized protein with NRDE domain
MCILFFALRQHPQYPVIICANRDEFHQRPTQKMSFWQQPKILAGKDLQAGGTWLGLTPEGQFSALTNYRQPLVEHAQKNQQKLSRGDLVLQALTDTHDTLTTRLPEIAKQYNGFNLVFGPLDNLNSYDSVNQIFRPLKPGFHSICNGALDDIWPKMALGQQKLEHLITENNNKNPYHALDIDALFNLMQSSTQASPEHLPDTGITPSKEQMLSAIFIVSPFYGTRTTSIITQDIKGQIEVYDRTYTPSGQCSDMQKFDLAVDLIPTG